MARPYLGGSSAASVSKTASFSIGTSDHGKAFILSGSAITVTLPTISSSYAGFSFKAISGDDSEHVISGGARKYTIMAAMVLTMQQILVETYTKQYHP